MTRQRFIYLLFALFFGAVSFLLGRFGSDFLTFDVANALAYSMAMPVSVCFYYAIIRKPKKIGAIILINGSIFLLFQLINSKAEFDRILFYRIAAMCITGAITFLVIYLSRREKAGKE